MVHADNLRTMRIFHPQQANPLLGDIPVLGWLFKNRRENDDRTEILVFITPKITNKGSLPCSK